MTRFETSQAVSSALSPVSVGAQNSYMTPQCSWVLSKKIVSWSALFCLSQFYELDSSSTREKPALMSEQTELHTRKAHQFITVASLKKTPHGANTGTPEGNPPPYRMFTILACLQLKADREQ